MFEFLTNFLHREALLYNYQESRESRVKADWHCSRHRWLETFFASLKTWLCSGCSSFQITNERSKKKPRIEEQDSSKYTRALAALMPKHLPLFYHHHLRDVNDLRAVYSSHWSALWLIHLTSYLCQEVLEFAPHYCNSLKSLGNRLQRDILESLREYQLEYKKNKNSLMRPYTEKIHQENVALMTHKIDKNWPKNQFTYPKITTRKSNQFHAFLR